MKSHFLTKKCSKLQIFHLKYTMLIITNLNIRVNINVKFVSYLTLNCFLIYLKNITNKILLRYIRKQFKVR